MSTSPSSLASVTLALRNLIQAAMPAKVEVSTLPPVQAEKFANRPGLLARVNLVCHQVSPNANSRNISLTHIDSPAMSGRKAAPMNMVYLVTVYGTASPEQPQSTERLLEAAYRAIEHKPLLTTADLEAALPGTPDAPHLVARISPQVLTFSETESLFAILQVPYRPTLVYQITITEE